MKLEDATRESRIPAAEPIDGVHAAPRAVASEGQPYLLIIEPDAESRAFLERVLGETFQVQALSGLSGAVEAARLRSPDLVLLDSAVLNKEELDRLAMLRTEWGAAGAPVLLISATRNESPQAGPSEFAVDDVLAKPFGAGELLARVGAHLAMIRVRREAVEREHESRAEAQALNEIACELAAEPTLTTLLEKVVSASAKVTGAKYGAFFYIQDDQRPDERVMFACTGAPRESFEPLELPSDAEGFGRASGEERIVRYDDVTKDVRHGRDSRPPGMPRQLPVRSYIAGPVRSPAGRTLGWIFLGHPEASVFTELAERIVLGMAAQASVALDNARLHAEFNKELEQRNRVEAALRESEQRYRLVTEAANDYIWDWNLQTDEVVRNDGPTRIFGYRLEQVRSDSAWGFDNVHPDEREALRESMKAAIDGGQNYWRGEYRFRRANGEYADVLTRSYIVRDAAGGPLRMISSTMDLTERRRSGEALRDSERRYRQLVQGLPAAVYTCDAQGRIQMFNEAAAELWGQSPEIGKAAWCGSHRIFRPDGTPLALDECPMATAIKTGQSAGPAEIIIERPDGTRRHALAHPEPVLDVGGQIIGAVNMLVDITERKQAEAELAATKDDLAEQVGLLSQLHDLAMELAGPQPLNEALEAITETLVRIHGADYGLLSIYDVQTGRLTWAAQVGFDEQTLASIGDFKPSRDAGACGAAFTTKSRAVIADLEVDSRFDCFREEARRAGFRAVHSTPIITRGGEILGVLSVQFREPRVPTRREEQLANLCARHAADAIENARYKQALRNSEERFRAVTMNAPVAIFIKDLEGRYSLCNPLASKALGRPQGAMGHTDHDLLPRDVADVIRQRDLEVISTNRVVESEDQLPLEGVERYFLSVKFPLHNAAGETVGLGGVAVDITDRKQAQQALRDSERRLLLATQAGKVGVWAWEIENHRVSWSESLQKILGMKAEDLGLAVDGFESLVHPDDRKRVQEAILAAVHRDAPLEIEFRARRPDGQYVWLFSNAAVIREGNRAVRMLGASLDITDRKQGEIALRESEERFRTLASHAPVGIFQSDLNGGTVYVNSAWCEMSGLTPDQARGDGWLQAIHPEDSERTIAGWRKSVALSAPSAAEFRFLRSDGVVTWLQGNAVPLRDANGESIGYIGTVADITARKEAEAALRNSERMYRAIGESIDYGIWVCDAEGRNIYCSESFLGLVGRTQEQCANLGWCDVLHPDDVEQTIAAWKQCVSTGASWDVEHRFRGQDGQWHPVLARGVPVRNDRNEIIAWVGINLDISELKEVESELRESESRFRNMADNAPVLIWVHGIGGCQYVNREFMHFVGGSISDVQGMNWTQYLHPDDAEGYVASYQEAFQQHRPIDAQFRFRRADGEYRWLSATGAPRFRPDGAFLGYVGCSVDITDIKASEAALREADRRKDDFLAMLGHELRNPLAGIVTGAQVLNMLSLDSEAAEMQAVIARQATYMSRIVDDLLDVSRIARGKLRLRHQYVNLRQLLQDTVDDFRKSRSLDQCELRVSIPQQDAWVWADAARLAQAFSNIIQNSFKFSDGPNVITVEMTPAAEGAQARICISDRGIGMTQETIDRIFEPFNQADNSLERSRGGLGLGLALTRGLIHLHGGTVSAESDGLGRGARFTMTLPIVAPPKSRQSDPAPANSTHERILIIDDRRDAILPLNKMLQMDGHTVAVAQDGPSGLAKAAEFRPHVVLCDIGLTGEMNGYAVCRALRARAETASTYLVAVTGYGHEEARRLAKEAGFNYHLTKPLGKQQLRELLSRRPTF
jgi:PAS domain S-box-containing protein